MMLKTPRLSRPLLAVLKILVRLDFARAVRFKMESLKSKPETATETTVKVMTLADLLMAYEGPLNVAGALLRAQNLEHVVLPLGDDMARFFEKLAASPLSIEDFKHAEGSEIGTTINLEGFQGLQAQLLEVLTTAPRMDISNTPSIALIPSNDGGGNSSGSSGPLMN